MDTHVDEEGVMTDEQIRRDERERLAALLRDNKETLVAYAKDKEALLLLIALLLEMAPSGVVHVWTADGRPVALR